MRFKSVLLAAAGLSAASPAAFAQQPPAATAVRGSTVQEVVVTATPFGVSEDALTANVDVLTRQELDTLPPAGLGDVLAGLPGVRSTAFAPGASRPVVRGLAGPRVQVLTNGLGQIDVSALSPDHAVASDPLEARRIEVIRGPSTLAYGGSAIGGVINVIDERVPETPATGGIDGRVTVFGSTVDDGRGAAAQAKIGSGPFVFSFDAISKESDDYEIPSGRLSQRAADALGVERDDDDAVVNSAVELTQYGAGGSYVADRGFLGASIKRTETEYGTVAEEEVTIDLDQTRVDLRGELDYGFGPFATTRASAGYSEYEHTEFEGSEVGTVFTNEGVEGRLELVQQERDGWEGAVGVQGLTRDFNAVGAEAYVRATEISELGIFTVQRIDRGDYGFDAGLRADQRDLDNVQFGGREFTNYSASGGVFVRPSEGLFVGLSAARNERAPDEAELFANGVHIATGQAEFGGASQDLEFDSEVAYSIEGTLHFQRGRFDGDAHAFVVFYDGFIDLRPTGEVFEEEGEGEEGGEEEEGGLPIFNYAQTNADFYGFELDAAYALYRENGRELRLEGTADFVHADTSLGPPARIPPYSVTARLAYASPPVDARVEVRRVGEQDRTAEFELATDSYTQINAYVGFRPFRGREGLQGVTLFVDGRNLTNEEAREHASFLKDIAPLPGRNLRAGLSWTF